jgi:hypothetical protein
VTEYNAVLSLSPVGCGEDSVSLCEDQQGHRLRPGVTKYHDCIVLGNACFKFCIDDID